MSKPRVLVFIDWYSPGFKAGGPVRSVVNMVDHLRDRIDLHIVTRDTEYTESVPYPGILADRWTTLPGGEKVWYASRSGIDRARWKTILDEGPWDSVYINGMYSFWFSVMPLWLLRGTDQPRVVAVRGMLATAMMVHGRLKKRLFLAAMKLGGCYRGVRFQTTNGEETRDVLRWISPDTEVHEIPNLGRHANAEGPAQRSKVPGVLHLLSVARIAVEKNTLFAIGCLNGLVGDITFDLYGPIYDQAYWRRCQKAIEALPENVRVRHRGTVEPESVPALFEHYHALFMPSQGENFGHSMAEALAAGLPLLISDRTPWKGLIALHAGWDLPLDDQAPFARAVERLVHADDTIYAAWSRAAHSLGSRRSMDASIADRYFALFTIKGTPAT